MRFTVIKAHLSIINLSNSYYSVKVWLQIAMNLINK